MLPLTWVKLNVRPEVGTEPNNFLMVRHFLAWMAWHVATSALTSFSFYQNTGKARYWISWDLIKNPANLFKNNLSNTRNNTKSHIQNNNINNNNNNNNNNNDNNNNGGIVELPTFFQKSFSWEDKNYFM